MTLKDRELFEIFQDKKFKKLLRIIYSFIKTFVQNLNLKDQYRIRKKSGKNNNLIINQTMSRKGDIEEVKVTKQ